MDAQFNDVLGELAADAALERKDFLVQAAQQLHRFLEANADRIAELGGLTLIDEEPDYLSIAPDLTFRSRSRYRDESTGQWVSDTEVIESPAELVELYNPSDVFAAFADAAREAAGIEAPTAAAGVLESSGASVGSAIDASGVYAEAADDWAAGQATPVPLQADDDEAAARQLYDLALDYQDRSQQGEARLLEQFQMASRNLSERIGDLIIVDDDDERLVLEAGGLLRGAVLPEDSDGGWTTLGTPEDLVEYYDPTDVFGDLADAIAEAYPTVAPEMDEATGEDAEGVGDQADVADAGGADDAEDAEGEEDDPEADKRA